MAKPNWANKTVFTGDNLPILRGMNSESVDLIYLDPPYNSNKNYAATIGSQAAGAEFSDTWTLRDVDAEWINLIEDKHPAVHRVLLAAMTDSDKSYLTYMATRLLEMYRILDTKGSLFLHCDPTMSHYLKLLLDAIFGRGQCRNEIIWCYTGPGSPRMRQFNRKHDTIFWFTKGDEWTFNKDDVRLPYKDPKQRPRRAFDTGGHFHKQAIDEMRVRGKIPETWWTGISIVPRSKTENTGFKTQKPLKLLSRIIKAATPPRGVVFDPFCGCATAMVAAEDLGRQWVGIDLSPKAAQLVVERIEERQGLFRDIIARSDIPQRTDLGDLPRYNCRENKETLYGQQGGHCAGCSEHFLMQNLTVDHIVARSKGGNDHIDNLQLMCGHCNSVKGDRGMDYLRTKLQLVK